MSDITERKPVGETARQSEERFRMALQSSPIIVFNQDRDLRYTWIFNPKPPFLAYSALGRTDAELFSPEEAALLTRMKRRVLDTGDSAREEVLVTIKGEVFFYDLTVEPSYDSAGGLVGITCAAMDITKRKRAEEAQRQSEERAEEERSLLATIVESSEDAIIGRTLDGTIISWNAGAERMFGYRAEEAVGRSYSILVPTTRMTELEEICEKVTQGKRVEHYETVRLRKDGRLVDISLTVSPIKDAGGTLVGLSLIGRDVTDRNRVQAELSRLVHQLGERIKELSTMYSVAHLLQMEEKSTTAMLQEIASLLPPAWQYSDVAAVRVQLGEMEFTTPNFRATRWSQQAEFITMDGRKGAVEVVYLEERLPEAEGPFLAEERSLLNGVAEGLKVYLDRKWLESEILEISDREQRRIGQDLHDGLSQHLRGIAYLSHVLQKDLAQESLPEAKDASRITQLLNKAILEAHSLAQGLFPTSLEAEGLMSALKELASSIKTIYKISCRFICPKSVLIDKGSVAMHLYRIAQEAVQNAIKHGKATRVVIRLTQTSEAVELAVKDNGKGLPKHFGKGKGMGLKIMDHRARMIGAELRVQRAVVGTLLTCSLRTRPDKFSESKICVQRNRAQSPKN